jgi:alpha-beta hydrolase superfamily lysophospholipase
MEGGGRVRKGIFSLGLTVISRMLFWRDRRDGSMGRILGAFSCDSGRLRIASGGRELSAVYVEAEGDAPVFLICHGIGERVEYWGGVQCLLKTMGVSSLVFNYSGYGRSTGTVSAAHCEEDAVEAYRELVGRGCRSIFLVGFSLGSGVVSAVASQLKIDGVILCEGYSTLREAAVAFGVPRWMASVVPKIWETVDRVRELEVPVLVMHSDEDLLFALTMAKRVAEACGRRGELIVVHGLSHDSPIFAPAESYWGPVVDWAKRVARLG